MSLDDSTPVMDSSALIWEEESPAVTWSAVYVDKTTIGVLVTLSQNVCPTNETAAVDDSTSLV